VIRLFLPYNKTILKTNIIFSLFLTLLSSVILLSMPSTHSATYLILRSYVVWILTGGFLLSAFYFEITRKNEFYFYYNLGLSKVKLLFSAYLLSIVAVIPILFIMLYV
jgi:hypothetical protein